MLWSPPLPRRVGPPTPQAKTCPVTFAWGREANSADEPGLKASIERKTRSRCLAALNVDCDACPSASAEHPHRGDVCEQVQAQPIERDEKPRSPHPAWQSHVLPSTQPRVCFCAGRLGVEARAEKRQLSGKKTRATQRGSSHSPLVTTTTQSNRSDYHRASCGLPVEKVGVAFRSVSLALHHR